MTLMKTEQVSSSRQLFLLVSLLLGVEIKDDMQMTSFADKFLHSVLDHSMHYGFLEHKAYPLMDSTKLPPELQP